MRKLKINTQERALSTDINRLQDFKERDVMEILRLMLLSQAAWTDGGEPNDPIAPNLPTQAEILQGLLVRPQTGTLALTVESGSIIMLGDTRVDGSTAYYVQDKGVPVNAPLLIASNPSIIASRIDIVECKVDSLQTQVGESRDVYDPTTDTFVAALLVKEEQERLTYRVRAGTVGGGWPGLAAGWVPLAVISVPPSATTLDTCTLWDVRPMLNDRVSLGPRNIKQSFADDLWLDLCGSLTAAQGHLRAAHEGRWLGGKFQRSSPGVDGNAIDFSDASNGGTSGTGIWSIYLCTPFGLPRWMRYTDVGTSPRVPRGCRGLVILSDITTRSNGTPLTPIAIPAAYGFGSQTTSSARAIFHGIGVAAATAAEGGVLAHGRRMYLTDLNIVLPPTLISSEAGFSNFGSTYLVKPDQHYPRTARNIAFTGTIGFVGVSGNKYEYYSQRIVAAAAGYTAHDLEYPNNRVPFTWFAGASHPSTTQNFEVPVLGNNDDPNFVPPIITVDWSHYILGVGNAHPAAVSGNILPLWWEV